MPKIRTIGNGLTLSLAKNSHFSFLPSHFPSLPSRRGHHCGAEIRNEFTLSIAKIFFALFVPGKKFTLFQIVVVVVVVVVDFIYSRWSNRQSLLKGTYWRKKKRRKGQKIEIWEGRINWLNHYGMNYNTELENYIQQLMSPTVNEMNLG